MVATLYALLIILFLSFSVSLLAKEVERPYRGLGRARVAKVTIYMSF